MTNIIINLYQYINYLRRSYKCNFTEGKETSFHNKSRFQLSCYELIHLCIFLDLS